MITGCSIARPEFKRLQAEATEAIKAVGVTRGPLYENDRRAHPVVEVQGPNPLLQSKGGIKGGIIGLTSA